MAQNIAIERVDHIGVRVRNLDRSLAFYRVLGFAVVRRAEGDDVAIIRNEHGVELNLVFNANDVRPQTSGNRSGRSGRVGHRTVDLARRGSRCNRPVGANPPQPWIRRCGRLRYRAVSQAGSDRTLTNRPPIYGGPIVGIHFPPARSQQRTLWLPGVSHAGGTKRCYGAGGEEMAPSSLWLTDGVPRCPSRTT